MTERSTRAGNLRRAGPAFALAVGLTLALSAAGHPGEDYRHSDFFQFWAAPRLLLEGADPYDPTAWAAIYAREARPPVATPPPPGRHIYPLYTAVPLLPFAALPIDVAAALWLVAQLAIVVVSLRALVSLYGLDRRGAALLFGLAAAFQPLWLLVGGGNMTGFLFGCLVAALVATVRRAPRRAGAAIGLFALKPPDLIVAALALLAAARPPDRRAIVVTAIATGALLVAVTVPFGPSWTAAFASAALERLDISGSNATVWTIGRVVPGAPLVAPAVASAALVSLALWWRAGPRPAATLMAGAVAVSVLVAPHGWSYDQLLLLVTLAAVLAECGRLEGKPRVLALVLTAIVAAIVPWSLYAAALARGGEEWSAITPILFFCLLALMGSWPQRGARGATALASSG